MASTYVLQNGQATVTVAAAGSIAVYTKGSATVSQLLGYPNHPLTKSVLGTVIAGQTVFGPYASGATIIIDADASGALYETGVSPVVIENYSYRIQPAPVALDATGTLTAAAIMGGLVTSTTAAAVAATLDTGTVVDAAANFAINDAFDWSVINTGAANAFTVTASATHTVVGVAAVAALTSARFRTRKTAANTFVTYRVGG